MSSKRYYSTTMITANIFYIYFFYFQSTVLHCIYNECVLLKENPLMSDDGNF